MKATRGTRIALRIMPMIALALLLAALPPLLLKELVLNAFFMTDDAESVAMQYQAALMWCHVAGIAALLLLNLIFFIVNEKRGDAGYFLHRRNVLQSWLNCVLIACGVLAMVLLRYQISSEPMIGTYLSSAPLYVVSMLSPYYVFALAGVWYWSFCMRAAPATNVAVLDPIMRKVDDGIKRSAKTR